jgi:hypothetical protein
MAVNVGISLLPGYSMPLGAKYLLIFDRSGPASYAVFVPATGVGGDIIQAAESGLGMGGFDWISSGMVDSTGQIVAYTLFYAAGYGTATKPAIVRYFSLTTATLGGQAQTAGAEIVATTNLSTFSWRYAAVMV